MSHGELDVLERQLEARDPDVRLMLQVRTIPRRIEALVQRYQDRLVGILYHLVGSLEEAEDLSQDVFLRIYKARRAIGRGPNSRRGCSRSLTTLR